VHVWKKDACETSRFADWNHKRRLNSADPWKSSHQCYSANVHVWKTDACETSEFTD
jgi:hypothetical protein